MPYHVHYYYIGPIIALVAGILILIQPRILNYVVASSLSSAFWG